MALRVTGMGLVVVLSAMLWAKAMAQSGCTTVLIGMAPCLNYITGSSSSPSSSCCSQLTSVVQSQPRCLCVALNGGGAALGITINRTLALALPGACNVQTPPVSQCDAADGPATPPLLASPMGSPEGTPDFPTSSSVSGGGSKTVPSNGADSSDGSIIMKMRPQLIAILLFMASYASVSSNL
ncbi:Non-specific lipid-transfer protein-like protein [Vitis vinifera]|uniref:Non-specific lipid-transfer protein-like protein n=1 Tax=Vitis vinifera TaxID=29760 RepID=A0A438F775_VITVI|nr:Non-specific lipid-transfer protein-like protein [Vitis vinifera]